MLGIKVHYHVLQSFNPQRGGYKQSVSNISIKVSKFVSIPKGEATNFRQLQEMLEDENAFQSPKGRLQTCFSKKMKNLF